MSVIQGATASSLVLAAIAKEKPLQPKAALLAFFFISMVA
jgi:hypothetical protein